MTYPPQSGPPGAQGWPGDPNQAPGSDPYGNGMPGGYPQQPGGYPQQPADPYAPPGAGMPGMPPMDPYGSPASGVPQSNPYSSPPGYGPPGMPPGGGPMMPSPAPSNNTGWIIGGVVGVVVILLAVVGTLFATGAFDGEENPTADPSSSADPTAEGSKDPAPSTSTFQYVDDICTQVNLGGLTEGTEPMGEPLDFNLDGAGYMSCLYSFTSGEYGYTSVTITVQIEADAAAAATEYTSLQDMAGLSSPTEAEISGSWDEGIALVGGGIGDIAGATFAHVGNMAMSVVVDGSELPYGESDIPGMASAVMESIITITAA